LDPPPPLHATATTRQAAQHATTRGRVNERVTLPPDDGSQP
jgi:uncharacterized lipoprotein YbaY